MERKMEILDAFMKLVSRFGIDKTTMQDVAKEAGISVGLIYKDFKNKEDLVDAYLYRMMQLFKISCEQILTRDLPPEQLTREFIIGLFRTMFRLVLEDRGFFQFINDEASIKYMRRNFSKKDEFTQEIEKMVEIILDRGVREGVFEIEDTSKTAMLFLSAFHTYFGMIFMNQTEEKILAGVNDMVSLLIRAIKKKN
jgi:AcrR family transcriptional regulator